MSSLAMTSVLPFDTGAPLSSAMNIAHATIPLAQVLTLACMNLLHMTLKVTEQLATDGRLSVRSFKLDTSPAKATQFSPAGSVHRADMSQEQTLLAAHSPLPASLPWLPAGNVCSTEGQCCAP